MTSFLSDGRGDGRIFLKHLWNREVWRAVWPIWLGYMPLGVACGVFAQKFGVTAWEAGLMSLLVFAGSGQFIALSMIGGGAPVASIVLTTFVVNLRHTLYSSSLAPYLICRSKKYLGVFAQGITDETFAVNLGEFAAGRWDTDKALALNILAHSCWVASNVVGNLAGNLLVVDTAVVGYTLTAMFIGLWSFHFHQKLLILTGVFSGMLALALSGVLTYKLHIVVATVVAATAGCLIEGGARAR